MSDIFGSLGLTGGSAVPPSPEDPVILKLVDEFASVDASLKVLKERRDALAEELARRVHVTSADVEKEVELEFADGRTLIVARGSRYLWDEDILSRMVDSGILGKALSMEAFSAIEHDIKVPRKNYDGLSAPAKAELAPALTIKPGALSVKVK